MTLIATTAGNSPVLSLHSASELTDLRAWALDHANEPATRAWLDGISLDAVFPLEVPVPAALAEDVRDLINDWCEVLAAHEDDEVFLTCMRPGV